MNVQMTKGALHCNERKKEREKHTHKNGLSHSYLSIIRIITLLVNLCIMLGFFVAFLLSQFHWDS